MNCPYCRQEMEKGYITSDARYMAWRKERYESAVVGKNGSGFQLSWGASAVSGAYCCTSCRKIVIDLGDI